MSVQVLAALAPRAVVVVVVVVMMLVEGMKVEVPEEEGVPLPPREKRANVVEGGGREVRRVERRRVVVPLVNLMLR